MTFPRMGPSAKVVEWMEAGIENLARPGQLVGAGDGCGCAPSELKKGLAATKTRLEPRASIFLVLPVSAFRFLDASFHYRYGNGIRRYRHLTNDC